MLRAIRDGRMDIEEGARRLRAWPVDDLGHTKLDTLLHRPLETTSIGQNRKGQNNIRRSLTLVKDHALDEKPRIATHDLRDTTLGRSPFAVEK